MGEVAVLLAGRAACAKALGWRRLGLFVGWISAVRADRDVLASFQSEQDLPLVDA